MTTPKSKHARFAVSCCGFAVVELVDLVLDLEDNEARFICDECRTPQTKTVAPDFMQLVIDSRCQQQLDNAGLNESNPQP